MFNSISWPDYIKFIIYVLLIYYTVVLWIFKKQLKDWIINRKIMLSKLSNSFKSKSPEFGRTKTENANIILFETCLNELNNFFEIAHERDWIKNELLFALKKILEKYSAFGESSNKEVIDDLVAGKCKDLCSVYLEVEELNSLWLSK